MTDRSHSQEKPKSDAAGSEDDDEFFDALDEPTEPPPYLKLSKQA